jgi:hypothetical protein
MSERQSLDEEILEEKEEINEPCIKGRFGKGIQKTDFLESQNKKFKNIIGKKGNLERGENILIPFSGGIF